MSQVYGGLKVLGIWSASNAISTKLATTYVHRDIIHVYAAYMTDGCTFLCVCMHVYGCVRLGAMDSARGPHANARLTLLGATALDTKWYLCIALTH